MHFESLNVRGWLALPRRPFDDRKSDQFGIFFRDPGCRIGALNQLAHGRAAEAEGRLEAELLDRVKGGKVAGMVKTVLHRKTVQDGRELRPGLPSPKTILYAAQAAAYDGDSAGKGISYFLGCRFNESPEKHSP